MSKEIIQQAVELLMSIADGEIVSKEDALSSGVNLHNLTVKMEESKVKTDKREHILSQYHILGKLNQFGIAGIVKTAMQDFRHDGEYPLLNRISKLEARNKDLEDAVKSALWVAKYYDKGKFKHLTGIAEQALNNNSK